MAAPPASPLHPFPSSHSDSPQREHDDAHFISQLRLAIAPHARYVAPWMTHEAMEVRVDKWLQTDWTAEAKKVDENEWRKWQGKDFRHVVL